MPCLTHEKGTPRGAFSAKSSSVLSFDLLSFSWIDESFDFEDGLTRIGVGIDGDRLGLVVFLAL